MRRLGAPTIVAFLMLVVAAPPSAGAATFKPTRFDDPPPGKCKPGNCSLREALNASNAQDGRDTIALSRGRYELEIPNAGGPDTGSVDLLDGAVLMGKGAGKTKIDANGIDRALTVGADGELGDTSTVRGLTVTGGDAGFGGGIEAISFENDKLELAHTAVRGNTAEFGGGIHADLRKLTVTASTIAGNEASSHGGGMRAGSSSTSAQSKVTISGSTIKGNEAPLGGGIYNFFPRFSLVRSTVAGNNADEGGGMDIVGQLVPPETMIRASTVSGNFARKAAGILADGDQPGMSFDEPVVTALNSTVAGNQAAAEGGGIMADNGATVNLDNATVAYNAADSDGIGGGVGGGVYQHSGAVFDLGDSVIAQNTLGLPPGTAQQCEGSFATSSDGLVRQDQSSGTCSFGGTYTIVPDALIGPLADNGGPTETVRLLNGSAAIGFAESCPKRDQRGKPRPGTDCDSGAFERKGP